MTLIPLEDTSSTASKDLPTINDWVKTAKPSDGDVFPIVSVKRTEKCLVITTTEFVGFVWNSEKLATQLLEAILHYMKESDSPELVTIYQKKLKRGFTIAADDEGIANWVFTERPDTFTQSGRWSELTAPSLPSEPNPLITTKKRGGMKAQNSP